MLRNRGAAHWIVALVLLLPGITLLGRPQTSNQEELKRAIEQRYTVLPIQNGIVLSPKNRSGLVSIEISGNTIAVDGTEVTGSELRMRLGSDADSILQLSYLSPSERQAMFGVGGNQTGSRVNPSRSETERRTDRENLPRRRRRQDDVVRFLGDVTVRPGETVNGDVVILGGDGQIDGQVNGDVVNMGGKLTLGPDANVTGDVAVVGGTLSRDPAATVGGDVTEVGGPGSVKFGDMLRNRRFLWAGVFPVFTAASTLVRLGVLILFGCVVMLVAGTLASRIGDRAAAEPVRAGLTGLLAELLFFPALIMTVVLLVITILGIPLLLLLPFAILAFAVIFLVGFTGVAARVGHLIGTRLGWTNMGPYLTTVLGIVAVLLPLVLARLLGLVGLNFIAVPLLVAGVLIEYLAWTVGLGAAALTYLKPLPPTMEQAGLP